VMQLVEAGKVELDAPVQRYRAEACPPGSVLPCCFRGQCPGWLKRNNSLLQRGGYSLSTVTRPQLVVDVDQVGFAGCSKAGKAHQKMGYN